MYAVSIYGALEAVEGKFEELKGYLFEAAEKMKEVETCYCYVVGENADYPNHVFILEIWQDEEAHQASLQMEVFQELISKARPIIKDMKDYPDATLLGGKF